MELESFETSSSSTSCDNKEDEPPDKVSWVLSCIAANYNMSLSLQKEATRLYWSKSKGRKVVDFNGMSLDLCFAIVDLGSIAKQKPKIGKRVWLQGTRKLDVLHILK